MIPRRHSPEWKMRVRLCRDGAADPFDFYVADLAMVFAKNFQFEPLVVGPGSVEGTTPFIAFVRAVCKETEIYHPDTGRVPTPGQVSDIGRRLGLREEQ